MAHETGDEQRPTKRRHVKGMLDDTDPLSLMNFRLYESSSTTLETRSHSNHLLCTSFVTYQEGTAYRNGENSNLRLDYSAL